MGIEVILTRQVEGNFNSSSDLPGNNLLGCNHFNLSRSENLEKDRDRIKSFSRLDYSGRGPLEGVTISIVPGDRPKEYVANIRGLNPDERVELDKLRGIVSSLDGSGYTKSDIIY